MLWCKTGVAFPWDDEVQAGEAGEADKGVSRM